ncbi:MAG: hypothetical protein ACOC56_02915 [Atribacterota bacterium]
MILSLLTGAYIFGKNKIKDGEEFFVYIMFISIFEILFYLFMIWIFFPEKMKWLTSLL